MGTPPRNAVAPRRAVRPVPTPELPPGSTSGLSGQPGIILGIDPGRSTGWAVFHGNVIAASGRYLPKSSPLDAGEYFDWMYGMLERYLPDRVCYEQALQVRQGGYLGIARPRVAIELACHRARVPWRAVYPATWRAWYRLGRKSDKVANCALASRLFGLKGPGDDEAEAALIAFWAASVQV